MKRVVITGAGTINSIGQDFSQTINSLNPVDLINAEKVVFTEDALTSLAEVLS